MKKNSEESIQEFRKIMGGFFQGCANQIKSKKDSQEEVDKNEIRKRT